MHPDHHRTEANMGMYDEAKKKEPSKTAGRQSYSIVLAPLMEQVGEWYVIGEYASPGSAYQAVRNLRSRKYRIPKPDHSWEFVNDEREVFARYMGSRPKRAK